MSTGLVMRISACRESGMGEAAAAVLITQGINSCSRTGNMLLRVEHLP